MNSSTRRPGMRKDGDTFMVRRQNNGHWEVRSLNPIKGMPAFCVYDFGYGDRESVQHRRALAARDRLQAFIEQVNADPVLPNGKIWLSGDDQQLVIDAVIAEIRA